MIISEWRAFHNHKEGDSMLGYDLKDERERCYDAYLQIHIHILQSYKDLHFKSIRSSTGSIPKTNKR